ncbi:MAG: hypothetical protein WC007_06985 [Pelobacteraceae bacterium]
MKTSRLLMLSSTIFLLCSCTVYSTKQVPSDSVVTPQPLVHPVGKNWQVIEEAPKLSDERGRLPFQTEQSVQPAGSKPLSSEDNRTIETVR